MKQNYTKMNTLFNGGVYWGCLQGTLIFDFRFYNKYMVQSSFKLTCFK